MPSISLNDYNIPIKATSQPLKPIPKIGDVAEDKRLFRVLESLDYLPVPAPLPEKLHAPLKLDRMVVSASMIRRIEHELKHDACDPRTVFNSCRGMTRGSIEFENAYISARIRSFSKHQRIVTDPLLDAQPNADDQPRNPLPNTMKQKTLPPQHPLAVNHPADLMSHLGIWVIALLGTQVWASWRMSAFAKEHLEGDRLLHFAIVLFLCLALDIAVWFRRRGRLFDAFFVPGAVLFLMALLPIFILHVREILLAAR